MKEGFYHDHHLVNVFFSHGCFHQQSNNFFNQRVKMAWPVKNIKVPPFFIHVAFLVQIVSVDGFTKSTSHLHFEVGCYCKEGLFLAWSFMGLMPPFFSWYASCD
jgi:hypothetical protein